MKTSAICFVCGSKGAHAPLHVRPRPSGTGSYFKFLENHDTPRGAKPPGRAGDADDGAVLACTVCHAFLNQQWESYETSRTPALKRIYWLKRVDDRAFTGAEMAVQGEYVAQMMGLQYSSSWPGGAKPGSDASGNNSCPFEYGSRTGISCGAGASSSSSLISPQNGDSGSGSGGGDFDGGALDLSVSPKKLVFPSKAPRVRRPAKGSGVVVRKPPQGCGGVIAATATVTATAMLTPTAVSESKATIVCYTCGKVCGPSFARFIYAVRHTDDPNEPYFPFLSNLPACSGSMPLTPPGVTRVCVDCRTSLDRQWAVHVSRGTPEIQRMYQVPNNTSDEGTVVSQLPLATIKFTVRTSDRSSAGDRLRRGKKCPPLPIGDDLQSAANTSLLQSVDSKSSRRGTDNLRSGSGSVPLMHDTVKKSITQKVDEVQLDVKNGYCRNTAENSRGGCFLKEGSTVMTVCYLCSETTPSSCVREICTRPCNSKDKDMLVLPFISFLPCPARAQPPDAHGTVQVCAACHAYMAAQWHMHEARNTRVEHRTFFLRPPHIGFPASVAVSHVTGYGTVDAGRDSKISSTSYDKLMMHKNTTKADIRHKSSVVPLLLPALNGIMSPSAAEHYEKTSLIRNLTFASQPVTSSVAENSSPRTASPKTDVNRNLTECLSMILPIVKIEPNLTDTSFIGSCIICKTPCQKRINGLMTDERNLLYSVRLGPDHLKPSVPFFPFLAKLVCESTPRLSTPSGSCASHLITSSEIPCRSSIISSTAVIAVSSASRILTERSTSWTTPVLSRSPPLVTPIAMSESAAAHSTNGPVVSNQAPSPGAVTTSAEVEHQLGMTTTSTTASATTVTSSATTSSTTAAETDLASSSLNAARSMLDTKALETVTDLAGHETVAASPDASASDSVPKPETVEVCLVCHENLMSQWTNYERCSIVQDARNYEYLTVHCHTCGSSKPRRDARSMRVLGSAKEQGALYGSGRWNIACADCVGQWEMACSSQNNRKIKADHDDTLRLHSSSSSSSSCSSSKVRDDHNDKKTSSNLFPSPFLRSTIPSHSGGVTWCTSFLPSTAALPDICSPVSSLAHPLASLTPPLSSVAPLLTSLALPLTSLASSVISLASPLTSLAPPITSLAPPITSLAPPITTPGLPRTSLSPPYCVLSSRSEAVISSQRSSTSEAPLTRNEVPPTRSEAPPTKNEAPPAHVLMADECRPDSMAGADEKLSETKTSGRGKKRKRSISRLDCHISSNTSRLVTNGVSIDNPSIFSPENSSSTSSPTPISLRPPSTSVHNPLAASFNQSWAHHPLALNSPQTSESMIPHPHPLTNALPSRPLPSVIPSGFWPHISPAPMVSPLGLNPAYAAYMYGAGGSHNLYPSGGLPQSSPSGTQPSGWNESTTAALIQQRYQMMMMMMMPFYGQQTPLLTHSFSSPSSSADPQSTSRPSVSPTVSPISDPLNSRTEVREIKGEVVWDMERTRERKLMKTLKPTVTPVTSEDIFRGRHNGAGSNRPTFHRPFLENDEESNRGECNGRVKSFLNTSPDISDQKESTLISCHNSAVRIGSTEGLVESLQKVGCSQKGLDSNNRFNCKSNGVSHMDNDGENDADDNDDDGGKDERMNAALGLVFLGSSTAGRVSSGIGLKQSGDGSVGADVVPSGSRSNNASVSVDASVKLESTKKECSDARQCRSVHREGQSCKSKCSCSCSCLYHLSPNNPQPASDSLHAVNIDSVMVPETHTPCKACSCHERTDTSCHDKSNTSCHDRCDISCHCCRSNSSCRYRIEASCQDGVDMAHNDRYGKSCHDKFCDVEACNRLCEYQWPGVAAIMHAYEQHYHDQSVELQSLLSHRRWLLSRKEELSRLNSSLASKLNELEHSSERLREERLLFQSNIDTLKRCHFLKLDLV